MAERCLTDAAFAAAIVSAQDAVVDAVLDAPAWWRHMRAGYDRWRETIPA
jgi:hypothetical protein